ncbi:MAG: phosphatase PAP2 family protein [Ferruginibacter sp.]|nr:phosphatase PAP2 family protein [Ferruginibacter sp.]
MFRILVFLFFIPNQSFGQKRTSDSSMYMNKNRIKVESFLIPSAMLAYGIIGLESHTLQNINSGTQNEILEHIDKRISIDDFSQYSPLVTAYGLDYFGVKSRNSMQEKSLVVGTAFFIMGSTVNLIKWTGSVQRPDGTSYNSFPSGHTATAFMSAEFLYQEYKHKSPWIGIAGYAVAAGTGYFRMYNNRHWLTDVAAGAGIGMLSTKIAYKLHPFLKRKLFRSKKSMNAIIFPRMDGNTYGVAMMLNF